MIPCNLEFGVREREVDFVRKYSIFNRSTNIFRANMGKNLVRELVSHN